MPNLITEKLENHFPIPVLIRQFGDLELLNHSINELIEELARRYQESSRNAATNGSSTTQGGYQTIASEDFLDIKNPHIYDLRDKIILPSVEEYFSRALNTDPLFLKFKLHSWANRLEKGNWQSPHIHPNEYTIISGVYYVRCPEMDAPGGVLEFINPHPASVSLGGQNATKQLVPKEGLVVMFPPYYMHFVHPITSAKARTIVAFDVRLLE